ncbi:MAG: glucose-6-phosphate isomerase [Candidatus Portiera sp.]|nr:glucose-6-phosphate isomerase [Portiera sp.]
MNRTDLNTKLTQQASVMQSFDMREAFAQDDSRTSKFVLQTSDIYLDYSKNLINEETLSLLLKFAQEKGVLNKFKQQLAGEMVNPTENQAATHTAMRRTAIPTADGEAMTLAKEAEQARARMYKLRQDIVKGKITGIGGKPFKRVINLGIGGSHLGGAMLVAALPAADNSFQVEFVSSLSPTALKFDSKEDAETSLIILSSKSFGTEETFANAQRVFDYYESCGGSPSDLMLHNFYAITASPDKAEKYGLSKDRVFTMPQSVGGRYSIWSAIGLPIIFHCGMDAYEQLIKGANGMDEHCADTSPDNNMPLILALLSYWYVNYLGTSSICINVYEHNLAEFPAFLQQLIMESSGKSATLAGGQGAKSEIVWGGEGTGIQHSYMQLCHQGNQLIPTDFIVGANPPRWLKSNSKYGSKQMQMHKVQVAHALAQSQALLIGRSKEEAAKEARNKGLANEYISHLEMPGNRPSNTLVYGSLSAEVLGALIALYEHKTALFCYLSDINPFDQWGVELGKQLSAGIKKGLTSPQDATAGSYDQSTAKLINYIKSVPE